MFGYFFAGFSGKIEANVTNWRSMHDVVDVMKLRFIGRISEIGHLH